MDEALKILVVEDVAADAELITMELESSSIPYTAVRVEDKAEFIGGLTGFQPDIILSDYTLPRFSALEALRIKNEISSNTPFILVTGNQTEEIAVECIKKGADDYILKSSLTRLPSAVQNAIQKKKAELSNLKAVEEIKQREEKYRNLFENSLVGMFRATVAGCRFLEANEKAKRILGVESVEGMHFDDFNFCNESGKPSDLILSGQPSIENFELQVTKPDGSRIWISISAKLYAAEGVIEGVIHDITQIKSSLSELEKANYELDRFAYHASHDLRSPLRSLEGLIHAASEEESIEEIRTCLKMMERSTIRLNALIDDLLTIARNKNSDARITAIDFYIELSECLSQLAFMDNFKKIRIIRNIRQERSFYSDAVRLRIILNNIISNAIKYHRLDQPDPFISVEVNVESARTSIIIRDNGSGISEKDLSRIFEMFYRATNSSEGTGLGLYLVKMTVEKLSGEMRVESEKGAGTAFYIQLPGIRPQKASHIREEAII